MKKENNKGCLYSCLLLYSLFCSIGSAAQEYFYHTYNTRNGLPSNKVKAVSQDNDGNIWIPSDKGITKFDGKRFKNFTVKDGLPTNEIFYATAIGNDVWLYDYTYSTSYICRDTIYTSQVDKSFCNWKATFPKRYYRYYNNAVFNTNSANTHITVNTKGLNFSISVVQLIKNVPKLLEIIPPKYFDNNSNWLINASTDGRILALSFDSTLITYNYFTKSVKTTNVGAQINSNMITKGVFPQIFSKYFLFVSDSTHILHFIDLNDFSKKQINLKDYHSDYTAAYNHFINNDGTLTILSYDNFFLMLNDKLELIDSLQWDKRQKINSINKDKQGNYWIATNNEGVHVVTSYLKKFKKIETNIKTGKILNIYKHNEQIFLFDNESNMFIADKDFNIEQKIHLPLLNKSYPEITKYWFYPDVHDGIYVASAFGMYYIDKKGTLQLIHHARPYSCKDYYYDTADDKMIVGSNLGFCEANLNNNKIKLVDSFNSYRILSINALNNNFCCTNDVGDIQLFNSKYKLLVDTNIKKGIQFSTNVNSKMVVATDGYGIFTFDYSKNKLQQIIEDDNYNYYAKSQNGFWVANNKYIARYDTAFRLAKKYLNTNGIFYTELYNINECDSITYVLSDKGIIQLPGQTDLSTDSLFYETVYISSISIGNNSYFFNHDDSVFTCDYSKENYTINFSSSISTTYSGDISFMYFIEDVGNDWVITNTDNISFAELAPGTYKIHLKAIINHTDISSKERVFTLSIQPLWWQSIIFKTIFGILILAAIGYLLALWLKRVKTNADKKNQQNLKVAELELTALQSQMNPHFIFNSLTSIQSFINTHSIDEADKLLQKFSLLVRLYLEFSKRQKITIEQELDTLKLYTEIESIRFSNKFDIRYYIRNNSAKKLSEIFVSPMLIQPLVENAINHGLYHLVDKRGVLKIFVLINDIDIAIVIDDNGIGRKAAIELRSKHFPSQGNSLIIDRINVINQSEKAKISMQIIDKFDSDGMSSGTRVILKYHNFSNYD